MSLRKEPGPRSIRYIRQRTLNSGRPPPNSELHREYRNDPRGLREAFWQIAESNYREAMGDAHWNK